MKISDLETVFQWRNHVDVRNYMFTNQEITSEEHQSWFNLTSQDPSKKLLIYRENGRDTGFVNISITKSPTIAEWGFYLSPSAPKGSGLRLGITALNHAFDDMKLHKINGQALAFNKKSIKFHQSLGFKQEGILREQHFNGKEYIDIYCFGLIQDEWLEIRGML